ncbi:peptidoglycan/LPS O-acetylase OafA/YrhL [Nitrosomonas sp. Nm84]|uniref:acyltransferase family protein n=1 Tax=Nitrosomonas sp. Nm84 TaxID=200124 RepID=UPI000D7756D6|nr:acyltransferase [Nitrosomonas sp. Nm84]PXW84924.1 peptidoglycan/LPS O-acetylase OafA/YrhL [Nitrosomonas sp. Nm84]
MHTYIGIEFARGIAAFMVLTSHYAYFLTEERTVLNFLWTGVDLFFVISGFVFAKLIFSSQINVGAFFIKRFFRIYPLYFVSLVIYLLLSGDNAEKVNYFINHIFFLHTTNSREEAFFFNAAFWSLPVEMEFYIFIPILIFFLKKYQKLLFGILIFSMFLKLFLYSHSAHPAINTYDILSVHLIGLLPEFLIGVYLHQLVVFSKNHSKSTLMKWNFISTCLGIALISMLAIYFIKNGDDGLRANILIGGWYNFACALSYAFLLFPLSSIDRWKSSENFHNIFIFIGSISYPVYLVHNAAPRLFQEIGVDMGGVGLFIACTTLTIIASIFLHHYIEEPFRVYGRNLSDKWRG